MALHAAQNRVEPCGGYYSPCCTSIEPFKCICSGVLLATPAGSRYCVIAGMMSLCPEHSTAVCETLFCDLDKFGMVRIQVPSLLYQLRFSRFTHVPFFLWHGRLLFLIVTAATVVRVSNLCAVEHRLALGFVDFVVHVAAPSSGSRTRRGLRREFLQDLLEVGCALSTRV